MKINRNNYEQYFIDYLDGNLDKFTLKEFKIFLEQNPDLNAELKTFEINIIEPPKKEYHFSINLKKPEILNSEEASYFDELCIGELEGCNTKSESKELFRILAKHPEKTKEFNLYKKTNLKPDFEKKYQQKTTIKRYKLGQNKNLYFRIASVAAALIISFMIGWLQKTTNSDKTANQITASFFYLHQKPVVQKQESNINKISPKKQTNNSLKINGETFYTLTNSSRKNVENINNDYIDNANNHQSIGSVNITIPNELEHKFEDLSQKAKSIKQSDNQYSTIAEALNSKAKKNLLNIETNQPITSVSIVKSISKQFNRLFGTNINIEAQYDNQGEMIAFEVNAGRFTYSKK